MCLILKLDFIALFLMLAVSPFSLFYIFQMVEHERVLRGSTSRTMAAISLGFIVIVTPYTIQEVVAACTGSKVIIIFTNSKPHS